MSPTLADVFAADPRAAVLRLLESAGSPLAASEIKQALVSSGVPKTEADRRWPGIQRGLRAEPQVAVEDSLYRWVTAPLPAADEMAVQAQDAFDALDLLVQGGLSPSKASELGDMVRTALKDPEEAARRRQAEIDGLRALSELAGEVEELLANDADPAVLLRRVRARAKRSGLIPIGRAGDHTQFDRRQHTPIAGSIRDGAPVTIVRPGYVWTGEGSPVVIGKAVVEE